ncbi:18.1 kDa class I heat shock protein-like [Selaginella moellendorffii]|uniref:18.1 kDa class I heat shock protein-like n=1 Tax=Selaginella moellendorffii TaxID=88036 RepID=UPI000D1D0303|nr:18.1 kDa class I heat shock protein-like [Selaginella moellendorffii]|eukprot:XP_024523166.1 18.1 kDa class I heat shock protein-like [Selaginella moellendorffii]
MALHFYGGNGSSIFDPFEELSSILAGGHEPSKQMARDASAVANTRVDWLETPEAHVFKADLPGLSKEEVKISVEDGRTLQISGERKKHEAQKSDKWHRVERSYGSFLRKFRLPESANVEAIKAHVENGVLTVTVPKIPKPQPRTIQVE